MILCLLLLVADGPGDDARIRALLNEVRSHQEQTDKRLENFGYLQTLTKEEGGRTKSAEVSEITIVRNRKVARLVSRNGKPLEGSELVREQKRVDRQVTELEAGRIPQLSNRRIRLEDLLKEAVFSHAVREPFDGREVWTAEFHPDPNARASNPNERFVHNLDGSLSIDPQAFQIARLEFVLREAFNVGGGLLFSMKPGTRFVAEDAWSFSKIWLPRMRRFDMLAKAMLGVKLVISEITAFSAYHEFNVSAR